MAKQKPEKAAVEAGDKTRAPRAKAADGSRGVHVALETVVLTDEQAEGLCFASDGAVPTDRRELAASARESVQALVDAALAEPLAKAVINLRKSRHDAAVALAEQEAQEAARKLDSLKKLGVAVVMGNVKTASEKPAETGEPAKGEAPTT